ncbi:hypothetical protein BDZ89DRAFT_1164439 [Hymenopellis radicata]|nr:hypothetical protein BDZ89DRAFT_1164439 [Hymenopellis radicata]
MPHMSFAARGRMRGVLVIPNAPRRNQTELLLSRDLQRKEKFSIGDFACIQCKRRYPTLERLREHFRGAKTIHPSCPACGRGFADHIELDEHKRMNHPNISLCMIVDCTRAGHDHRALMNHVYSDHSQRVECRFCHNWYNDDFHLHNGSHKAGCPNNRLDTAISQESAQFFETILAATTERESVAPNHVGASIGTSYAQRITEMDTPVPSVHREAFAQVAVDPINASDSSRQHSMLGALSSEDESLDFHVPSDPPAAASLRTGVPPATFNLHTDHYLGGTQYHWAPMNPTQPFANPPHDRSVTNGIEGMSGCTDVQTPGPQLGNEASIYRAAQHDEEWTLLQAPDAALPNQDDIHNTPATEARCESPELSHYQAETDKPNIIITAPDSESDTIRRPDATDSCTPINEKRPAFESLLSGEFGPLHAERNHLAAVLISASRLFSKSQTVSPTGTPLLKPKTSLSVDSSPAATRMQELWDEMVHIATLSRNATPLSTPLCTPDQPLYPDNAPYPLLNERSAEMNNPPCGQDTLSSTSALRSAHDTPPSDSSSPKVYHGRWSFGQNSAGALMCAAWNGSAGPFSEVNGGTFCGRCCP